MFFHRQVQWNFLWKDDVICMPFLFVDTGVMWRVWLWYRRNECANRLWPGDWISGSLPSVFCDDVFLRPAMYHHDKYKVIEGPTCSHPKRVWSNSSCVWIHNPPLPSVCELLICWNINNHWSMHLLSQQVHILVMMGPFFDILKWIRNDSVRHFLLNTGQGVTIRSLKTCAID